MKNSKRPSLKTIAILCSAVLSFSALAACGNKAEQKTAQTVSPSKQGEKQDPYKIRIMSPFYNPAPPPMKPEVNPLLKKVQEMANVELQFDWVANSSWSDKFSVAAASNTLPMVFTSPWPKEMLIVNMARQGALWELGPYLKSNEFPNINKYYDDETMKNLSIDGKIYALPRSRLRTRVDFVVRQDWLDNLDMKVPETPEEFYEMCKAFTAKDPDKNGKNDTYGFAFYDLGLGTGLSSGFNNLVTAYGGFNDWGVINGKAAPSWLTNEYMQALKLLSRMYAEKLISPNFSIKGYNSTQEMMQGKVGARASTLDWFANENTEAQKINPNARVSLIPPFKGKNGQKLAAMPGHNGGTYINKKAVTTEGDLKKILKFYDTLLSDQLMDYANVKEFENVYWKKSQNGGIEYLQDRIMIDEPVVSTSKAFDDSTFVRAGDNDSMKLYKKYAKDWAPFAVSNAIESIVAQSKTYSERGPALDKIVGDARVKFIMGAINEEGYKKEMDNWLAQGGQKVIDEYSDTLKALK